MNCLNSIDAAILLDYWLAALSNSDAEAVEEHLFACDECGARLQELIALAEEIRKLARQGSLIMVVGDAFLNAPPRVTFQQSITYAKPLS
jgi:anti-sigma factor RsiW